MKKYACGLDFTYAGHMALETMVRVWLTVFLASEQIHYAVSKMTGI